MDKVFSSAAEAVADISSGSSFCVGGFGLCGVPIVLIDAVAALDIDSLHVVSNNCGTDGFGLGVLLSEHRIARVTASYVGENAEFARQYLAGEVEVELTPQGSLAERMRAGGCGIPAFYTLAGVGTLVGDGGLPWRYAADGSVALPSPKKETRTFNGRDYILEESITTDYALVRAAVADTAGNLVFHESARNFNPLCAMAGRITIVEAEEIVGAGEIAPDEVHLPGIFVQRIAPVPVGTEKRIEKRTVAPRLEAVS
ncbi:MAG TPA: CoA transferase subunit A [Acidimicrobiales bacterium]|nr:CoA transferase subunit A [Acidimicrobiales bacterium]